MSPPCASGTADKARVANVAAQVAKLDRFVDSLVDLARNAGRVLSHALLLRAVWGPAQADQLDYLRVAIRSLRMKLEADPAHPGLILNEPSVGYRLVADQPQS